MRKLGDGEHDLAARDEVSPQLVQLARFQRSRNGRLMDADITCALVRRAAGEPRLAERLAAGGAQPSVGSAGGAYDIAMTESFRGRAQTELLKRQRRRTRIELANALFEYLEIFHNRRRRHCSLGELTPIEYELRTTTVGSVA